MTQIEIERKFIIKKPAFLKNLDRVVIKQTYLLSNEGTRRVRSWEQGDVKKYYFTSKKRISALSCEETECEIGQKEYEFLLLQKDPHRKTIEKIRYFYPVGELVFEIDEYPFWQRQCVMEIELSGEEQEFSIPMDIEVICEVTEDKSYKNFALAKRVPEELI